MSEVKYTPMRSDITVLLPKVSTKTESGAVKTKEQLDRERSNFTGAVKVIHVGPNVAKMNLDPAKNIAPGDKVLLSNNALLSFVNIGGLELGQVDAHHVLGILNK